MREEMLKSGRDAFLVAAPLVLLLFIGVFRLDEVFGEARKAPKTRRFGGGQDEDGEPILSDPDGTPVLPRRQRR
jgi:hypothetical protein